MTNLNCLSFFEFRWWRKQRWCYSPCGGWRERIEFGLMGGGGRSNKGDFIPQGKTVFTLCVPLSTAGDSIQWNMEIVQLHCHQAYLTYEAWVSWKGVRKLHETGFPIQLCRHHPGEACYCCNLNAAGVVFSSSSSSISISIQSRGWSMCPKRPLSS